MQLRHSEVDLVKEVDLIVNQPFLAHVFVLLLSWFLEAGGDEAVDHFVDGPFEDLWVLGVLSVQALKALDYLHCLGFNVLVELCWLQLVVCTQLVYDLVEGNVGSLNHLELIVSVIVFEGLR